MNPHHQHPLYFDHDGTNAGLDEELFSHNDTDDEIILLRVQNHHLNSRLMDHVRIDSARTEQITTVMEENEALREELAGLAETIEIYEANARSRQRDLPRSPSVVSERLPVRRSPSPGHMRSMGMRAVTSLGQRSYSIRTSFLGPDRPQTSQGYTAPLRTPSTSPSITARHNAPLSEVVRQAPTIDSDDTWEARDEAASPPPTPTLNLLPPTPAPRRYTRSPKASASQLGLVLTALSDRKSQSTASRSHSSASDYSCRNVPSPESAHEKRRNLPSHTVEGIYGQPAHSANEPLYAEPDYGDDHAKQYQSLHGLLEQLSSHNELHEMSSERSESNTWRRNEHEGGEGGCGRQTPSMADRQSFRSMFADNCSTVDHGLSADRLAALELEGTRVETDSTSGGEADSDYRSVAEVEAMFDEEPIGPKGSMSSTHSKRDSNMPDPQDMILDMAQMMRLERKEREEERAQWVLEKRTFLQKRQSALSPSPSAIECACLSVTASPLHERPCCVKELKVAEASGVESCDSYALPPAYDFLKPWTYPLPYQSILLDIEDRLEALQRQSAELSEEKRLFAGLARAATTRAI